MFASIEVVNHMSNRYPDHAEKGYIFRSEYVILEQFIELLFGECC